MSASDRRWVLAVGVVVAIGTLWAVARPPGTSPPSSPSASSHAPLRDAAPPGPRGRASALVYDEGHPVADRWVVFHDADGEVISSVKSDHEGRASGDVPEGGMITVLYGTSVQHLVTFTAVKPDDEVLVGEKEDDEAQPGDSVARAAVTLPPAFPSATRYGVSLGVGLTEVLDPTRPVTMPVLRRFVGDDKRFPVLAVAIGEGETLLAYAHASAPSGATDGGTVDVRLGPWSKDWREHRLALTKAPAGATTALASLAMTSGKDRFDCGRRRSPFADGAATAAFAVPAPLGKTAIVHLEVAYGATSDRAFFSRRIPSLATQTNLDLSALLLPRVTRPSMDLGRTSARPVVRWEAEGGGAKTSAIVVQVSWPETKEHRWTVVAPPSASPRVELPALPPSLGTWAPDGGALAPVVGLVSATEYATWADVEKKGLHLLSEPPEDDDATVSMSVAGGALVF
ncbi:MAG: hypothetical protein JST00_16295 [Deltaproteobacteria bacterium]|nr:hypothetical protein [Deltaproteobacteria bacterium]